jgi:uncharacterized protein (DUF2141 family)
MRHRALSAAVAVATLFAGSTLFAGPASAARIVVTIDGLRNAGGNVFVGLYASPAKFLQGNQTDAQRRVRAGTGPVTVVFDNLPPGTYAVGAFHDENGNDHFDTDFVGLPTEGYALSNGVRAVMAKPTFQQAAFSVGAEGRTVGLHIRY